MAPTNPSGPSRTSTDGTATGAAPLIGTAPLIGGWSMLANSAVVELLARAGFDWVCLDAQHGQYDDGAVAQAMAMTWSLETPVLVRVAANDAAGIGRALDAGAAGVIVPMVNSAADAERAVRACLYPPVGDRSRGPFNAHRGRPLPSVAETNAAVQVGVMVETAEALDNVDTIASVPGVGFVFVGPLDLSIDLGTTIGALADGDGEKRLETVVRSCREHGIGSGVFSTNPDHISSLRAMGFTRIAACTDVSLLQAAARDLIAQTGQARPGHEAGRSAGE